MAEQIKIRMTMQEFIERYEQQPFELINGEIWEMSPVKKKHSKISKRMYDKILYFLVEHEIGEVFFETAYVLEDKSDWVKGARVPDILFYELTRYNQYEANNPDSDDKPFVLVPDLVVEVISPTDGYSKVSEKIDVYLSDGVRLMWIVDPQRKTIAVYEGSASPKMLREEDNLSGGIVLAGFTIAVMNIFAGG